MTKGLEVDADGSLVTIPVALDRKLPATQRGRIRFNAIGGPCTAHELAARRHTSVVFTGADDATLSTLRGLLATPYCHVWTSTDVTGVEVCAAMKNAYALGVAIAVGQSCLEMRRLVELLGGDPGQVSWLPGAGDLYVTVFGDAPSACASCSAGGCPSSRRAWPWPASPSRASRSRCGLRAPCARWRSAAWRARPTARSFSTWTGSSITRSRSTSPGSRSLPLRRSRRARHGPLQVRSGRRPSGWPSEREGDEAGDGGCRESRDRGLGRTRREHELEEGHRITPLLLQRSHGTVAAADDEPRPFHAQEPDVGPEASIAPSCHDAGPDVPEAREADDRPRRVDDPERPGSAAERGPARPRALAASRVARTSARARPCLDGGSLSGRPRAGAAIASAASTLALTPLRRPISIE